MRSLCVEGGGVKSWTGLRGVNYLEKEETGALLKGDIRVRS